MGEIFIKKDGFYQEVNPVAFLDGTNIPCFSSLPHSDDTPKRYFVDYKKTKSLCTNFLILPDLTILAFYCCEGGAHDSACFKAGWNNHMKVKRYQATNYNTSKKYTDREIRHGLKVFHRRRIPPDPLHQHNPSEQLMRLELHQELHQTVHFNDLIVRPIIYHFEGLTVVLVLLLTTNHFDWNVNVQQE